MTLSRQALEDLLDTALEQSNSWWHLPNLSMLPLHHKSLSMRQARQRIIDGALDGIEIPVTSSEDDQLLGYITREGIDFALDQMVTIKGNVTLHAVVTEAADRIMTGDYRTHDADIWFQFVVMGKLRYS